MNFRILCLSFAVVTGVSSAEKKADLTRLAVIGDSLAAAYLNGSLHEAQQPHGFASLIAQQAGTVLPLPLIAVPGIPNVLTLVTAGPPPVVLPAPGVSTGRVDLSVQAFNLAVPLHNVADAVSTKPSWPVDSLTDLVLGLPGLLTGAERSQVEWAEALSPTTILVWIGSNDALRAAILGDPALLTSPAAFEASVEELMTRLAATNATLVVANIPDVFSIPYLVSAESVAAQAGVPLSVIGPLLGIAAGDFVTLEAVVRWSVGLLIPPFAGSDVLTASEAALVRTAVDTYNGIIAAKARSVGAGLVDIFGLTRRLKEKGYVLNGRRFTTNYLGGIFSLDGIHPTYTAHAIVATEFIRVLNSVFGAGIPPVVEAQVAKGDPLAP